jgi:Ser/Thr protein kinase RdoA (MazF antagonist)
VTQQFGHISTSSGQSSQLTPGQREKFAAEELAIVMSHFDIGVIRDIREFPRGSRKAPKLVIESETGQYLLKRRARGRDDSQKVAFSHHIQLHLAQQQFPLPHLIGTRRDNSSMLSLGGHIYELFEFIPGQGYPMSLDSTAEAGRVLGLFHKLLENFPTVGVPLGASYHNANAVEAGIRQIIKSVGSVAMQDAGNFLIDAYAMAALRVENLGIADWFVQIVHADWHPGNMLFQNGRVVAVIDYDSARVLQRIIDMANGALQFSIQRGDDDISKWPEELDESRFKRFVRGYEQVVQLSLSEIQAMPSLMIESMIAEAVIPILATGGFAKFDGASFLSMVQRKVAWIQKHANDLIALASD